MMITASGIKKSSKMIAVGLSIRSNTDVPGNAGKKAAHPCSFELHKARHFPFLVSDY